MSTHDANLARYMAAVADAIKAVDLPDGSLSYYVSEVRFAYEGEDQAGRVVPDEFGGYGITFDLTEKIRSL